MKHSRLDLRHSADAVSYPSRASRNQAESQPTMPDDVAERMAKASAEARKNLDISLVHFPEQLKNLRHWILWRYEADQKKSGEWRITKVPYIAQLGETPRHAATTRPKDWRSLKIAQTVLKHDWERKTSSFYDGLAFVFTDSGYSALDMDHVLRDGSALPEWVERLMRAELHATYTEHSISHTGLHSFLCGTFTGGGIKEKFSDGTGLELYCSGRCFVVSGQPYNGAASVIADLNPQVLHDRFKRGEIGPDDFCAQKKAKAEKRTSTPKRIVDVKAFFDRHRIEAHSRNVEASFTRYSVTCPGCHRKDAYVLQHSDGGVSMGCYSASCAYTNQKDHWYDFKKHYEAQSPDGGTVAKTHSAEAKTDPIPPEPGKEEKWVDWKALLILASETSRLDVWPTL